MIKLTDKPVYLGIVSPYPLDNPDIAHLKLQILSELPPQYKVINLLQFEPNQDFRSTGYQLMHFLISYRQSHNIILLYTGYPFSILTGGEVRLLAGINSSRDTQPLAIIGPADKAFLLSLNAISEPNAWDWLIIRVNTEALGSIIVKFLQELSSYGKEVHGMAGVTRINFNELEIPVLPQPVYNKATRTISAEVVHITSYGSIVTNITKDFWDKYILREHKNITGLLLSCKDLTGLHVNLFSSYPVSEYEIVGWFNTAGFLELGLVNTSLSQKLDIHSGEIIILELPAENRHQTKLF